MFEKPTLDDFLGQLGVIHDEVVLEFGKERAGIQAKAAAAGALQSGRTIIAVLDAMERAAKSGTSKMLGELRRATRVTEFDPRELRDLTVARIEELTSAIISASKWDNAAKWIQSDDAMNRIEERIVQLKSRVQFWVRQFDVGFDTPAQPEPVGQVTNVLHARDITGPVQQGQGTLALSADIRIDIAAATRAVDELEGELSKGELPNEQRAEIESDLATIKAQLRKPRPSVAIVREAGRSVRNITEGVVAGTLTPQGIAAAALLARALGI